MDGFKQIIDDFKSRLGGLSFNQKVLLGAVGVTSIISVAVFSLWLQKEEMAVLFTNLSPEDASAALEEISKQDLKAELTNGGTTILVPENQVDQLRMTLKTQGILSGGIVGLESFEENQYGLTEFSQNVKFKRAMEGELTRTIEGMPIIRSARVHLVLPKPSIFNKADKGATASVVVRLGRGQRLTPNQVTGIQSLVAGSVENLEVDKVTVIDQNGAVLSSSVQNDATGQAETQLEMRKEVEAHLAQKATAMLDQALGSGRSIVQVAATLNFEKIKTERETFDPKTVVRSEERDESNDGPQGGTQEKSITNYELNREVAHIVGEVGNVTGLSVSVFVDGHYETPEDGGDPVYTPLSDDELSRLRRVVQTAVGLNSVRGDQIEIVNMQFQNQFEVPGGGFTPDWVGMATRYGGKVVLLIMLAVMVMALRKNIGQVVENVFQPAAAPQAASEEVPEHFDGIPEMDDRVINDIQEYATENPDRVAEVIQSWIHDIDLGGPKAKQAVGD